jgi:tetratricopeptide (TPR) repeat protein
LRFRFLFTLLWGVLLIALCGFATLRSVRIARADWRASAGSIDALQDASRLAPDDGTLAARLAIRLNDEGDQTSAVEGALQRAALLNPFNPAVLMALGLRKEFQGNSAGAEAYLVRAAEIDHQFKPAWTLANYYYRAGQPDKSWPMIGRLLQLEPLGFDPTPVFELCWKQTSDNGKILRLVPRHGHRPIQYLGFLAATHRIDAAVEVWPVALAATDTPDSFDIGALIGFVDFLSGSGRLTESVAAWDQLVDRGIIHYGRLDPAKGRSIADPDFSFAPLAAAFSWHLADIPGVFASRLATGLATGLRFEINGEEPQSFEILTTVAPVLPATKYRLLWKTDGASLSSPEDPGFSFHIVPQQGGIATQCPPLLARGAAPVCDFVSAPDMGKTGIVLGYTRAQGTTRISGILRLADVRLEPAR